MKQKTEKEIIEFIKKWKCGSADGNKHIDEWEQDDIRRFFRISKKEFKEDEN